MLTEAVEGVRWINTVLGFVALLWLGLRSYKRWDEYPYTIRLFLLSLSFFVFGVTYGSLETALQNAEVGARSFIYLVGNIALLITLALTQKRRPVEMHKGGGPVG